MTVTLYLRENVTSQLTALYASIEGNSEYDPRAANRASCW